MNQNNQEKESIDVSGMLKKTDSGDKPQASWQRPGVYVSPFAPKIIRWVIKYSGGLIRNERQAGYLLLGLVVLAIIVSLFLFFGSGRQKALPFREGTPRPEVIPPPPQF